MADEVATTIDNIEQCQTGGSLRENRSDQRPRRGRPRSEQLDNSAAERRRTQIRDAQRSYRQRKETAHDELRKRVTELETILEVMKKTFTDCIDRLNASGLSGQSTQYIRKTSAQFAAIMKDMQKTAQPGDQDGDSRGSTTSTARIDENASSEGRRARLDLAVMDSMYANGSDGKLSGSLDFNQQNRAFVSPTSLTSQTSLDISLTVPLPVTPPTTYSFQETTFGRRIHRSCLQQSYQLILQPERTPAVYEQVFGLCLKTRNRSNLTSALKQLLSKGSHECLHSNPPVIHIGGAGTHYPRRDCFGNLRPKREAFDVGVVGPQILALLETAARENLTKDMTVDLLGYEGEWLDSYDVEGYLNEKGVFIDPTSSFAEVEIRGIQGRVVTIDVDRFVKLLTACRVCLGWCPGFKRRDVDRALAASSLDTL